MMARIAAEESDQGYEGLRKGSPDGSEQTADSGFGNRQALPGPFHAIGKKLGTDEDNAEAEGQDYEVNNQVPALEAQK